MSECYKLINTNVSDLKFDGMTLTITQIMGAVFASFFGETHFSSIFL